MNRDVDLNIVFCQACRIGLGGDTTDLIFSEYLKDKDVAARVLGAAIALLEGDLAMPPPPLEPPPRTIRKMPLHRREKLEKLSSKR